MAAARMASGALADAESEIGDEAPMMLVGGGEVLELQTESQLVVAVAGEGGGRGIFVPDALFADVDHHLIDFRLAGVSFEDEFGELAAFVKDCRDDDGLDFGGQPGSRNILGFFGDTELRIQAIEYHRGKISELRGLVV